MSNWAGVWIGLWEGDWEGASSSEPGILNAALNVAGSGTATFNAELIGLPVQETGIGGGGRRRRGALRYSEVRRLELPGPVPTFVSAALVVTGRGSAQFTAQVGQRVDAGMVVSGTSRARLGAAVSVSAGMQVAGDASSALRPAVSVSAALQAAGASHATFAPETNTRTVVVPLRPRVELADDELAAILYLMAA